MLGTLGENTDRMLTNRGLELVDAGERDLYGGRAVALALDDRARGQAARSGRELFEREFTWDAVADRLVND